MLITNARLVTWEKPNRILEKAAVYIEAGRIAAVGSTAELIERYPQAERLSAAGQVVMPGNICAHTHFYGAFARGMAIPGSAPRNFPEILGKLWWPLDRVLTHEDIRSSTLVCLLDAIRHGTTTLVDHHASGNAIEGSLDVIAEAVAEAGVRAVLCYEVSDRDGPDKAAAGIAENVRFLDRVRSLPEGSLVAATFGLHASLTLSDATLEACAQAEAGRSGFHIHAAESDADQYDSMTKSGMRVVNRLERFGILTPRSILAHCVRVDEREIDLLAERQPWVTHQPRSNMNNGVGVAPVEAMLQNGVKLGLGNDGFSNAMWEEWKAAYLVHKVWHRDPRRMSAAEIVRMAVYNNASLAADFFPGCPPGAISPGAAADLIFVDYHPFTPLTADNLPWQIIFGFHESMITTTIVAGRVLMKDRRLLTLDEEQITAQALERSSLAWKRYQENLK